MAGILWNRTYLISLQMRTGIFVGSFNPFTVGHDSIVRRALPLFDRLVIGVVGDNVHKPDMPSAEERMHVIRDLYANEKHIEVKPYFGLAMDFAKSEGAQFIVKGVRSVSDFEYEQWQADFNRRLGALRLSCSTQSRNLQAYLRVPSANCRTLVSTLVPIFRNSLRFTDDYIVGVRKS